MKKNQYSAGPKTPERKRKVGFWWSKEAEKRVNGASPVLDWACSPLIQSLLDRRVAGVDGINWLGWINRDYLDGALELGLSVGCGTGLLERDALSQGLCLAMEGVDIAEGALEVARTSAGGLPVTYRVMDLESDELPQGRYDIAFCSGTLHHINRLDHCLGQLHRSLKEGGLLAIGEYAGPSRFQWAPLQMKVVCDVYSFLPASYRYNYLVGGTVNSPRRPDVCAIVTSDPSEAVRSGEMLKVVERYFDRVALKGIGGTILNPLLFGIMEHFRGEGELDSSFLELAAALEESLISAGVLPSDFVVGLYRRKPGETAPDESDRERSELILAQEIEINELLASLKGVEKEVADLLGRIHRLAAQVGSTAEAVRDEARACADLKRGAVFRAARALRFALVGRGSGSEPDLRNPPAAGPADSLEGARMPAPMGRDCFPLSPEARAVREYVRGLASGAEMLWVRWLEAFLGESRGSALLIGFDLAVAEAMLRLRLCGRVEAAPNCAAAGGLFRPRWRGCEHSRGTEFDLVVLDADSADVPEAVRASEAVGERGVLVVAGRSGGTAEHTARARLAGCMPRSWALPEGCPHFIEGTDRTDVLDGIEADLGGRFAVRARRRFPVGALSLCDPAAPARAAEAGMAQAVMCLALYAEWWMAETGEAPAYEVRVFERGTLEPRGETDGKPIDTVTLQAAEIRRIRGLVESSEGYRLNLEAALGSKEMELEEQKRQLEYLARERRVLERGGPLKFARLALLRAQRGK